MKTSILISALVVMALLSLNSAYAEDICQYASGADATSESDVSKAPYAIGIPDAPTVGECGNWSGAGYSWAPQNWNITANLTLRYDTPVNAKNITVTGDYNMCTNGIWIMNGSTGKKQLVRNSIDNNCTSTDMADSNFPIDTVILQTCGWSWSATDAVQLCGAIPTGPVCGNGKIEQGEDCDDSNNASNDGCSSDCKIESMTEAGCSYALNAESQSELQGYEAIYSTGVPDSDGSCGTAPSPKTAWQKAVWNVPSNITFSFPYQYPGNLAIFGDYDLCINRVWFWRNNSWYLAQAGAIDRGLGLNGSSCSIGYNFGSMNFKTNKAMIETCGWSAAAVDAAMLCGTSDTYPKISIVNPEQDKIIDRPQNSVQLQISTDTPSKCEFHYEKNFDTGDGIALSTSDGLTHSYNLTKPAADSVNLYYKCESNSGKINPYNLEHRINFGKTGEHSIEICNWQNCSEGAASFSMDDGYQPTLGYVKAVCQNKLDEKGIKGTYFLAYTNTYNQSDWNIWKNVYANGHEIGGHSVSHACTQTPLDKAFLIGDTERNIAEITQNIGMPASELATYAWPCGNYFPEYGDWLSPYYRFARGYNFNQIESKNPRNPWNYKSINTLNFGDNPPDYFTAADATENYQDWVNYVYHDYCNNPEIMDYLPTKSIWIDTIGSVSKYIKERQSTTMKNIVNTSAGVKFDLVNNLDAAVFNKELTLRVNLGAGNIDSIAVNGANVSFTRFSISGQPYAKFNVPPGQTNTIEISGLKVNVPYCGDAKINQKSEECDDGNSAGNDGCSSDCKNEIKAYVMPYVGDIDGSIGTDWFYFYDKLEKWHEDNNVSVAFSIYPKTIRDNIEFNNIVANMYKCPDCEIVTKSQGIMERDLDKMSYDEVKEVIGADQEHFRSKMQETLGTGNVSVPVTYNQLYGRFTKTIRSAVRDLGFRSYIEQYITDEHGYINPTPDFDITQYAVSFTYSGHPGYNETFKQPNETIRELLSFENDPMLYINGIKVIPLMVHQQDFRVSDTESDLNETKWNTYTETLSMLKNDSRFRLLKPQEVYNLRHPIAQAINYTESGNFTGNTTINETGNYTGNMTGNFTGNHTGNFTGNFTGNETGNATGNNTIINTPTSISPPSGSGGGGGWVPSRVNQTENQTRNESIDSPAPLSTLGTACPQKWICSSWSQCSNGSQIRECADINKCSAAKDRPATSQSCGTGQAALNTSNQTTLSTAPDVTTNKVTGGILSIGSSERAGFMGLTALLLLAALYLVMKKRMPISLFRKHGTVSKRLKE